jgi:methionyl-tRNA synthetase
MRFKSELYKEQQLELSNKIIDILELDEYGCIILYKLDNDNAKTDKIMSLVENANKYYDEQRPWIQKKEDINGFNNTIYTCTNIIANLSNLFEPFMPKSCKKIREYLKIDKPCWNKINLTEEVNLENIEPLFNRI